ncbi:MerR family transcriptional regulator [Marinibacterium profundimaris]|uniref:MerR family transcriptional regulator n=1 Tax=Marinibacterium profundimaris TaxID=1679460 RepID=A0A225NX99_9RHOB|nr:MerR family transcriptional regulator [Marinibacterium profundimaris]OWU77937.1 MerR family transcriptional regulator [Marinibacterium profundimaris]
MKISEVAARSGLSIDTLRFYERIGLIDPPPRDAAGRRDYPEEVLTWIGFLDKLNATGMKQADRIRYAALRRQGEASYAERRRMLELHRDVVIARQAELEETRALMDRKVEMYRQLEAEAAMEVADV